MVKQIKYHIGVVMDKLTNSIINTISGDQKIMGYIKEPAGINFIVDPTPLTIEDRKKISELIAYYKATGRKKLFFKSKIGLKSKSTNGKKALT